MFPHIEIQAFNLRLRTLNRSGNESCFDWFVFRNAETAHHILHSLGREDTRQIILERDEELRRARIALPARASTQLIINSSRLMPLCAQHK